MKTSIALTAILGMLLPVTSLEAAPASKKFGDFTAGQKFKLTVTDKKSVKVKPGSGKKNVAVPNGIPDFAKGEKVSFTIGKSGQLRGPGFSIVYREANDDENYYANEGRNGEVAKVEKTKKKVPTEATLIFYKFGFSGLRPVNYTVKYELK